MGTDENLQTAFAGESQANRKYTAFSRKAEQEGFTNIAQLFKAAAEAETVHDNKIKELETKYFWKEQILSGCVNF